MVQTFFEELLKYVQLGGLIMWPLIILTFVLWYAMGYRWATLQRGNRRSVRILIERYRQDYERPARGIIDSAIVRAVTFLKATKSEIAERRQLDDLFFDIAGELGRYSILIRSIVAISPLLGLLGTVMGMIEMFNSLGDAGFYSQSGGIASGISQALFTTQLGLAVAVPGMIIGRMLDKRALGLRREIDQIKDILCSA